MDIKLIIVILSISSFIVTEASSSARCGDHFNSSHTSCDEIFKRFHKCTAKFIETSLDSANPFVICSDQVSYGAFKNMSYFLDLLSTRQNEKNHTGTCSDEYLHKNRMSVISTIVKMSKGLWEESFCDDCYSPNTTNSEQIFSDHTIQFKKLHLKYSNCTLQYINKTNICKQCEEYYTQLNIMFNHHKEKGGKICFDLEDIMNKTRQEWSGTFKCCKDKRDSLTAFYSLFSTIMVLAVAFYVSVYCIGSNHSPSIDILDERQISGSVADTQNTPSTSSSLSGPTPSTASAASSSLTKKDLKKPVKSLVINDDDSDDENCILQTNTASMNNQLITLDD